MGSVYRARDTYTGSWVALKVLHSTSAAAKEMERFTREAQLLSELRHPGIVSYVAHGQTAEGHPFLAMEWLDGEDLGIRLRRAPLSISESVDLIKRVADALAVAHRHRVVHRDLKPSNLFLPGGQLHNVKLLDFGIARRTNHSMAMTKTGLVIGTPEYMSPEQARGARELTPSADIFSLGCVLYECLTGKPPFIAEHLAAVLVRILFEEPAAITNRRAGVPPALQSLLTRMLAKEPTRRPADAQALARELEALGALPTESAPYRHVPPTAEAPITDSFAQIEQGLFCVVLAGLKQPAGNEQATPTLPPEEAKAELARRRALSKVLTSINAQTDWLMDGTLVVTLRGLPSAQDQAAMAAYAALRIKEQWPDAQVALCTGRGSVQGALPIGEAAERAARLLHEQTPNAAASARPCPSGVWLDSLTARLLERRFAISTFPGWSLLTGKAAETDETRPLLGKPTACVGREAELSALEGQLAGAIAESEARAVFLTGAPGSGKSRLRHELLRRLRARGQVIRIIESHAELYNAGTPFAVMAQAVRHACDIKGDQSVDAQRTELNKKLLERLQDERTSWAIPFLCELCGLGEPLLPSPALHAARQDPKIMHEQTRRAIIAWLGAECGAAPALLILDDLQWSDGMSLSLLEQALQELDGMPFMLLALARPEIKEAFPNLWAQRRLLPMSLPPLSRKACERLAQQVLGPAATPETLARLYERSGGNALFLEEIARPAGWPTL